MIACLPKYSIILGFNQSPWLGSARAEGVRWSSAQLHLDAASSATRDVSGEHNVWTQPDGDLRRTCSSELVSLCAYVYAWTHISSQTHMLLHISAHLDTYDHTNIRLTQSGTHTLRHAHPYTRVILYAVTSSSCRYTHTHTHRVFYTKASCITAWLSHMIELATVKFCGFLLS